MKHLFLAFALITTPVHALPFCASDTLAEVRSGLSGALGGDVATRQSCDRSGKEPSPWCNIGIGVGALANLTTGSRDIAIGTGAGDWITTESDVLCLGKFCCSMIKEGEK